MKLLNIKSLFYILSFALLLSACMEDELLYPVPQTDLTVANIFDTPDRIEGLVNGLYNGLKQNYFYGGRYVMYGDFRGEDFINNTNNIFTGYDTWSHNLNSSSNEVEFVWRDAYLTINQTNFFIQNMDENRGVISDELADQYIAEAKFVRALCYFSLVTYYARPYVENQGNSPGLPLRLMSETDDTGNDLARSTVAEVYAQILQDLSEAESGLPESHGTSMLNTTRAHRNTAISLKTRVYLNMGDYPSVIQEAQKIVSPQSPFTASTGVSHALNDDVVEIFRDNFTSTESILSMPMTELSSATGQNSLGFIYNISEEYYMNTDGVFGNPSWRAEDARRTMFRESGGVHYMTKYSRGAPFLDFVPIIRYAEVLLNYAEALAKTGTDLQMAQALLEEVRHRSDPEYSFPPESVSTGEQLVETIWLERRMELLGEGFRSYDLLRNMLTFPAKGSSSLTAPSISPNQEEYIFPLPNLEIITNNLLVN